MLRQAGYIVLERGCWRSGTAELYAVPEIRRHLDNFYLDHGKKPCYATQLGRKYDAT